MARVPLKAGSLSTIDPAGQPRLLGSRCLDCRQLQFPAAAFCAHCSGSRCESAALSPEGVLYAFTAVEKSPPGYRGRVPYGFGVVELPEGIRLITRLAEHRVDRLAFGMPMRLVLDDIFIDDTGDQVVGWAFSPAQSP